MLFPSLAGYGAQFGMHVYAPITPWPVGTGYEDFEAKVKALDPHLVRIFYNDNWDANADGRFPDWRTNYASRPYVGSGHEYDAYRPAYRYGWESSQRHGSKTFDEAEPELRREWESAPEHDRMPWETARAGRPS